MKRRKEGQHSIWINCSYISNVSIYLSHSCSTVTASHFFSFNPISISSTLLFGFIVPCKLSVFPSYFLLSFIDLNTLYTLFTPSSFASKPTVYLVHLPSSLSYFYFFLPPQFFSLYHKFSWIFLPPFTGILETDITFLIIFSMVFLLSCYFACKYCLLFLSFNVIGIQSPPEMQFLCQIYYKIYMVSWWDGSKFSCFFR